MNDGSSHSDHTSAEVVTHEQLGHLVPYQDLLDRCCHHGSDLIAAARTVLTQMGLPNVAYHLAALALEEIGKASLAMVSRVNRAEDEARAWFAKRADDHVKKLFWALWGPAVGRDVITSEQIEAIQGFAKQIHENRLRGLYVSADILSVEMPKELITQEQAESLVSLAEARLELAKQTTYESLMPEERADLTWFSEATDDPEKRGLILGQKSMEKLAALGHPRKWMAWLRKEFEEAEVQGRVLAERELKRSAPSKEEADKIKWKIKVRFFTNSHSIRPKSLNWWNGVSDWIKLFPVGKKKGQLIAEFALPKRIPVQALWWTGWGASRKFIVALNIGSLGFFWWYVPEHVSRFYERLQDVEAGTDVVVERQPILRLDWKRDVLSEHALRNTAMCFGMMPGPDERESHQPFNHYFGGLAFLSKNDIHLQCEPNAYEQFYLSLKAAFRLYGDWDGAEAFADVFARVMKKTVPTIGDVEKYRELGEQFACTRPDPKAITLSEVGAMKLLCDAYLIRTFERMAKERDGVEKPSEADLDTSDATEDNESEVAS